MNSKKLTDERPDDEGLEFLITIRREIAERHASEGRAAQCAVHTLILNALIELQERRKSFRWISIDEELPEDESTVIVKNIDGVQWVADFSDDCFYPDEFPVYKMRCDEVTHWMRFPE